MDLDLIIGSGILYFLFLFIYGHYSLNTCLIWDEIKALVKSSFCFYIALLVLVPKSTGYERRMHLTIMVASMFIICLLADRYIRIAFRDQFARRTLVIGTGYEAARLVKISNNNRFALTQVKGYVDANWTDQLFDFKQENVIKNSFIYSYEELDEAIKTLKIEQIIVALPEASEEVIDKVIYLNGKRLVITGVNRHEWNPKTGRCIGMQEMTADIDCMLRNNINAVRTCHYPDQIPLFSQLETMIIQLYPVSNDMIQPKDQIKQQKDNQIVSACSFSLSFSQKYGKNLKFNDLKLHFVPCADALQSAPCLISLL